ncbi:MAG: hypothetical protein A2516_10140 [Alphaproteobacteria bacterium RIFOXYD12_FULL_60_8]|nr:MAG: hypothetical protein A2516_10140 [Alphaproteobacteria bacterium RIFOXYD12_FULL_60_8]
MSIQRKTYEKGGVIFTEGEEGSSAFLIEKGSVEISRGSRGGKVVLASIGANGVFGEMALLDDKPRMATAMALEETSCLVIPADIFEKRMESLDPFMKGIWRIACNNLRILTDRYIEEKGVGALQRDIHVA